MEENLIELEELDLDRLEMKEKKMKNLKRNIKVN